MFTVNRKMCLINDRCTDSTFPELKKNRLFIRQNMQNLTQFA